MYNLVTFSYLILFFHFTLDARYQTSSYELVKLINTQSKSFDKWTFLSTYQTGTLPVLYIINEIGTSSVD